MNNLLSEILEEYDTKYSHMNLNDVAEFHGTIYQAKDIFRYFLHQAVKRAYEEGTKDAVKYIAERSESQVGEFTSLVNDSTFKEALSELNKKEK